MKFKACVHYFRIFYQKKLQVMKMFFLLLKKFLSFSKHSSVCTFLSPSFPPYPPLLNLYKKPIEDRS